MLPQKTETICIGAGAAGLFLCAQCPDILLLEKMPSPGRKILATGGGLCNLTHDQDARQMAHCYNGKENFVSPAIHNLPPEKIRSFFSSLALDTVVRPDGKVFPARGDAHDVVAALMKCVRNLVVDCPVTSVLRRDDGFILETAKGTISCTRLVIATGGLSYPGTGSTGDGLAFAHALGHSIVPPRPALCQLVLDRPLGQCEGVDVKEARVRIGTHETMGPLVITARGVSGPAAMDISRHADRTQSVEIAFAQLSDRDILGFDGAKKLAKAIAQRTGLASSLVTALLGDLADRKVSTLTKEERKAVVKAITAYSSPCSTKGEMARATVTCGGVDTAEVDRKTMASRICPGLYIIGEALDVDGCCGGYNLSFAFASAALAARSLSSS